MEDAKFELNLIEMRLIIQLISLVDATPVEMLVASPDSVFQIKAAAKMMSKKLKAKAPHLQGELVTKEEDLKHLEGFKDFVEEFTDELSEAKRDYLSKHLPRN